MDNVRKAIANILHVSIRTKLDEMEMEEPDEHEQRARWQEASTMPKPFPFDEASSIATENFRGFQQADYDFGKYLYSLGFEDPDEFAEMAEVIYRARKWQRSEARREAMGTTGQPVKSWIMPMKDDFMWCVTTYDQCGIDFFTGAWTAKNQLGRNVN